MALILSSQAGGSAGPGTTLPSQTCSLRTDCGGGGPIRRDYWYHQNIAAYDIRTDGIFHYHNWNEMYWGPGATYPGRLQLLKYPNGPIVDDHSFNGNAGYSNPGTDYTEPWCRNSDSVSHYVERCTAGWAS